MPTYRKRPKKDWLVGRWRASGGEIAVLFDIDKLATGFRIEATDESDGERLIVSKVSWDGKVLSFETRTPSNNWRTKNRLKLISKTKACHELTHWEPWEKIPPKMYTR